MIKNNLLTKILITLGLTFSVSTFVNADRTANGVPGDGVLGQVLQSLGGGNSIWTATSSLGISGGSGSGNSAWTIGSGLIYNATSTDKVGIGTSTPGYPLTVVGTSSLDSIISGNVNGVIVVDGVRYAKNDVGLQSALDFCSLIGGGKVFLPSGTYTITNNVNFYTNCNIFGVGKTTKLILSQGKSLRLWNISNTGIDSVFIDATAHIAFDVGVSIINSSVVRITNNYGDFGGFGIFTNTNGSNMSTSTWITDNYVIGHGNNDVIGGGANATTSTVTDVFVSRNHCVQNANEGDGYTACIDMVKAQGWSYTDNITYGDVYFGAEVSPNKTSIITGNRVFPAIGTTTAGVLSVAVNVNDTDSSKGIIISNNTLIKSYINLSGNSIARLLESQIIGNSIIGEGVPAYCIKTSDILYSNIVGNSCQGVINGIVIGGTSQYNNISSNTIDNSTIGITESVGTSGNNTYSNNIMVAVPTEYKDINNTSLVMKSYGGNLILGTSTPTDKLQVQGNITPSITDLFGLGSSTLRWLNVFSNNIFASSSVITNATSTNLFSTIARFTNSSTTNLTITGLTNGSVLFTTSSGLVSQSNSQFFWDNTNSRLGIGTNAPSQKLEVNGTISLAGGGGYHIFATAGSGGEIQTFSSLPLLLNRQGNNVAIGSTTAPSTLSVKGSGTTNPLTIASSTGATLFQILANGNVGVGTSSPNDNLAVVGNVNITGSYKVNGVPISSSADGVGTSTADYIISKNGSNVVVYDTTANTNTSYSDFDDAMNAIIPTATSTGRSNVAVRSGIYAINSSILYSGNGTVYSTSLNLTGAGGTSTLLVINTPKGFNFSQRAKVNFSNLGIAVGANTNTAFYASTTSGIMASIMDSSFSDIIAVSTTTGHTGYVFDFIGDFRNNYENIRAYQVGNLWRSQNNYSNAQFINGDSNWYGFNFCEINNSSTTASGVCWELKGNNGQVNQVIFGDINGISNDSGAGSNDVFLKLTNATRISMPSGGNAEQFATTTQVVSGNGIFLAFTKYVTQTTGATGKAFLSTGSAAYNVNVQCKEVELSAATIVWSDKNTLAGQSNRLSGINGGNCIMTDNGGSVVWATSTRSSIEGIYNNIDGSTSLAAWKVLGDKIVSNFSGSMNNFLSDIGSALRIFRGGVERFTFTDSGSLGIGSSTPNYKLSVVGTVGINGLTTSTAGNAICILASNEVVTAGGTTCVTSSSKTKSKITTLKTAKEIMKLRPVSYVNNEGGDTRYGLIAEEAAKVDPILVEYAKSDLRFASSSGSIKKGEPLTVDYQRSLITKMLKFVQDLYTTVQNLSNRTSNVELRLEKLEAENRSLLKRIDELEKTK